MDLFAALLGLTIAWQAVFWTIATIIFPLFWLWMLIDSIQREPWEYPNRSSNEKLVWVLVLVFVQVAAVVYAFAVFRKAKRGTLGAPAGYAAA